MNSTLQALLRQSFLSFARKAIRELEGTKLGDEPYLQYLADELDQFAENETHRLIVNLPPGHLKTWLASTCLTAWLLAHDPCLKVIIVTHAEHLSKTIARNIRSILQSTWFKEVFASRIKKGHAEVTDFGTTVGGGVFVTSFRGGFTGRRADVTIVDDPHDISDHLEEIESTIECFNTVLLSRLNDRKNGRVLVVAQRVHERDLSAHLLQKKKWIRPTKHPPGIGFGARASFCPPQSAHESLFKARRSAPNITPRANPYPGLFICFSRAS